jgi:hypothetical protein
MAVRQDRDRNTDAGPSQAAVPAHICGSTGRRPRAVRPHRGATPGQWAQLLGAPLSSAVRKLDPQPHAETAFGLFTVKPAPMSVST